MTPTEDEGDSSGKLSETVLTDAGADSSSQGLDRPRHPDKGNCWLGCAGAGGRVLESR